MVPDIILGTVQFGLSYGINNVSGKPTQESVTEIFNTALDAGITILDTAEAYGDAIDVIGTFHKQSTRLFKVNTKFSGVSFMGIRQNLKHSLEKMNIEAVETLFYHSFRDYEAAPGLTQELKKLKESGEVKQIGVSVYTNQELETVINDPEIDVIQLPFNLLDNYYQRGALLQRAKLKGKKIQARSVFLQGLFFKEPDSLPAKLQPFAPYLQQVRALAQVNRLSMESLCLQYVNAQPFIDEIIIGVDTKEHLIKNLSVLQHSISPEACNIIDSIEVKETGLLYPYNWDLYKNNGSGNQE